MDILNTAISPTRPTRYQDYDCFFNWITPDKPFTFEDAERLRTQLEEYYPRICSESLGLKQLTDIPFETISQHLCKAFCDMVQKRWTQAEEKMHLVATRIRQAAKEKINIDYFEGWAHVFEGLEALRSRSYRDSGGSLLEAEDQGLSSRDKALDDLKLPPLGRVAVRGVQFFFLCFREMYLEARHLLKEKLLDVDPENVEWLLNLHLLDRKCGVEETEVEGEVENDFHLAKAVAMNKDHVMVKFNVLLELEEYLKAKNGLSGASWMSSYGFDVDKNSRWEIFRFIEKTIEKIIPEVEYSISVNLAFAELLMTSNDHRHNDGCIENCLNVALQLNPESSRAQFRMGVFLLKSGRNLERVRSHLEKAHSANPTNTEIALEYANLLISNALENRLELKGLFAKVRDSPNIAPLLVAEGWFHYFCGLSDFAVVSWLKAYKLEADMVVESLKNPTDIVEKYKWNKRLISTLILFGKLQSIVSGESTRLKLTEVDRQNLETICGSLFGQMIQSARSASTGRGDTRFEGGRSWRGRSYGSHSGSSRRLGDGNRVNDRHRGNNSFRGRGGRRY